MPEPELPEPGLAETESTESKPPDDVDLFRYIWCPDDGQGGQVLPNAFSKGDLQNLKRRVSVDRADQLNEASIKAVAEEQRKKANPAKGIHREEAFGTLLNAGAVRAHQDHGGVSPFSVEADPIEGNPAHWAIGNKSGKTGKAYVLGLRTALAALCFGTAKLEEFFER